MFLRLLASVCLVKTAIAFMLVASPSIKKIPLTRSSIIFNASHNAHDEEEQSDEYWQVDMSDSRRRGVVVSLGCVLTTSLSGPSLAEDADGFDRAPLFGLAQQIKRSAVRGAQVIDQVDGKWERFSDDFGLGSNRNKPKVDKLSKVVSGGYSSEHRSRFNEELAFLLLQECDSAFLSSYNNQQPRTKISAKDLASRVENVKSLVRKTFFSSETLSTPEEKYNYEIYARFKAYNDVLMEQKAAFSSFYDQFEHAIGTRLVEWLIPQQVLPSTQIHEQLQNALKTSDAIGTALVKNGFITSWERSVPSNDDIEDFLEPYIASPGDNFSVTSDLKFTLALMGDATLKTQLLLQELGYRLYPSFGRWALRKILLACFTDDTDNNREGVTVNVDDYYMDTAYNSNPDLFEVRQILLNVVLQRN